MSINNSFIHFGCWNNGNCTDQKSGLSQVAEKLKKIQVDFISIAGDNYYPDKDKNTKTKIFNEQNFISGFKCLPDKICKYVIYGNHDIEDIFGNEKCFTLTEQIKNYSTDNKFIFFNDVLTYDKYNNFIIIFIDTTLYTLNSDEDIDKTCYKHLFKVVNFKDKKIKDIIEHQNNKIFDSIKNKDNVIIIGHHPICSIKKKKDEKKYEDNLGLINLFSNEKFNKKKIYYLCADTHYYQKSTIKINQNKIVQYIVGTGGAELDEPVENYYTSSKKKEKINDLKVYNFKFKYKVKYSNKAFGFIKCTIKDNDFIVEFINANNELQNGGYNNSYKNKYIKYKNKYLNLKY